MDWTADVRVKGEIFDSSATHGRFQLENGELQPGGGIESIGVWVAVRHGAPFYLNAVSSSCMVSHMTATAVIEEIKLLPPGEQSRVLQFAFQLARERQLPGKQLSELAQQMADSTDPAEVKELRDKIHRGFYGE